MRKKLVLSLIATAACLSAPVFGTESGTDPLAEGKSIAFDRKKGNCLACHSMAGGESPGTIGPPLVAMKARFPEKSKLRAQIADPMQNNPETSMPPFGRHRILTPEEIDRVVEFIWSL